MNEPRPRSRLYTGSLLTATLALMIPLGCGSEQEQTVRIIRPSKAGVAYAAQGPVDRAGGATLAIRRAGAFNSYLVDGDGRALYIFTPDDDAGESTCFDDCAEAWPAYLTHGRPVASQPEVDELLIDTIERDDDSVQVTYGGWPLYYYASDSEAGDTAGHGAESFGGTWYLLSPDGKPIREKLDTY